MVLVVNINAGEKKYPVAFILASDIDSLCYSFIGIHKKVFCLKDKGTCIIYLKGGNHAISSFTP